MVGAENHTTLPIFHHPSHQFCNRPAAHLGQPQRTARQFDAALGCLARRRFAGAFVDRILIAAPGVYQVLVVALNYIRIEAIQMTRCRVFSGNSGKTSALVRRIM